MKTIEAQRTEHANRFWNYAVERQIASRDGHRFHKGAPFHVLDQDGIRGLRVCIIKLDVGFESDRLLKLLNRPGTLPHLVPWTCTADRPPIAYSDGKFTVIEAPWPPGLERGDIQLFDVRTPNSLSGDVMVLGQNQAGVTIGLQAHEVKHVLLAGETGSGKTFTMRSIAAQLAQPLKRGQIQNQTILIDGKNGAGMGVINGLPGQIGPLALDMKNAANALGWCVNEMNRRSRIKVAEGGFELGPEHSHIYIYFDEFQTWTLDAKNIITVLLHTLLSKGRDMNIHVVGGTQKPLVASFGKGATGSASAGQLGTRIGLSLETPAESRIVMGSAATEKAKCHLLLGAGDSYVKTRSPHLLERTQLVYISEVDLQRMAGRPFTNFDEWPEFDPSVLDVDFGEKRGRRPKATTAKEYAVGIEAKLNGHGTPWFRKQFSDRKPGADRANKTILPMCEKIVKILKERGVL